MILQQQERKEITLGTAKEMSFSIDSDNPMLYDILRNKLYQNKIRAIAREIASNSRDANREAGRGDVPIEIEFNDSSSWTNLSDCSIIFRDFGFGITPDRVANILIKYGSSTKRHTNSQTGGFGLGAKTPFAYTDSFIVKTTCDWEEPIMESKSVQVEDEAGVPTLKTVEVQVGKKPERRTTFVYNAIIDSTSKGKLILMHQEDVKPEEVGTGSEFIIPITSNSDRDEFEDEVYRSTMFWDNVNYIGFRDSSPKLKVAFKGEGYKVVESYYLRDFFSIYGERYLGLLDGIPYPLEVKNHSAGVGDDHFIILDLQVGEVTINASRESIQSDTKTTTYVNNIVSRISKELDDTLTKFFEEHSDLQCAFSKTAINRVRRSGYGGVVSDLVGITKENEPLLRFYAEHNLYNSSDHLTKFRRDIKFNGERVDSAYSPMELQFQRVNAYDKEYNSEGNVCKIAYDYTNAIGVNSNDLNKVIIVLDLPKKSAKRTYGLTQVLGNDKIIFLKLIKGQDEAKLDEGILRLKELGFTVRNYSEFEEAVFKKDRKDRVVKLHKEIAFRVLSKNCKSLDYGGRAIEISKSTGKVIDGIAGYFDDYSQLVYLCTDNLRSAKSLGLKNKENLINYLRYKGEFSKILVINQRNESTLKKLGVKKLDLDISNHDTSEFQDIFRYFQIENFIDEVADPFFEFPEVLNPKILELKKELQEYKKKNGFISLGFTIDESPNQELQYVPMKLDLDGLWLSNLKKIKVKYPLLLTIMKAGKLLSHYHGTYYTSTSKYDRYVSGTSWYPKDDLRIQRIINELKFYIKGCQSR